MPSPLDSVCNTIQTPNCGSLARNIEQGTDIERYCDESARITQWRNKVSQLWLWIYELWEIMVNNSLFHISSRSHFLLYNYLRLRHLNVFTLGIFSANSTVSNIPSIERKIHSHFDSFQFIKLNFQNIYTFHHEIL